MLNMLKKIYQKLSKVGVPVAYGHFDSTEDIHVPFIIYRCNERSQASEGDIHFHYYDFNIELYYRGNNLEIERKFKEVLHEVKKVIDYEQSSMSEHLLLRATFSLLEKGDNENE